MPKILKEAKLFEAQNFPERGFAITEENLTSVVGNFPESGVPVKIQHTDSPLDGFFGTLTKIWNAGKELFGSIEFDEDVWSLIERAGARKLSVGFNKALDSIVEVSLVKSPRIGDAKIFCFETDTTTNVEIFMDWSIDSLMSMLYEAISSESEDMYYGFINKMYPDTNDKGEVIYSCNGKDYKYSYTVVNNKIEMSNKQEVVMPSDGWMPIDNEEDDGDNSNGGFTMTDLERLDALEAENAKLKAENAKTSNLLFDTLADNIVGKYKAEGKITPASEKFAKAILMGGIDSTITFEEKETNINTLFANFLDSLPTAVEFSEKLAVEEVTETEFDLNSKIFKGLGITKERLEKFVKEDK